MDDLTRNGWIYRSDFEITSWTTTTASSRSSTRIADVEVSGDL